ncbi:MAG: carbamoyltransferase HypF [Bdellovibrionaceae bacterium]|nr:carbamoyltransferase HypF [Pseudobdellovibrionaceae bacterium]
MKNSDTYKRLNIKVSGIVQGVGFRPAIYQLASQLQLKGRIKNLGHCVSISLEGPKSRLEEFQQSFYENLPQESEVEELELHWAEPQGLTQLLVEKSKLESIENISIPADLVTCESCLEEFYDPKDRRFLYPFIACTHCGPRYSIVNSLPYDRENTSMKDFVFCKSCNLEYTSPSNKRFHAQNFACAHCGPKLTITDSLGKSMELTTPQQQLSFIDEKLKQGNILALKGIGGYQLICDATSELAIQKLRLRKGRPHQALAMMVRDESLLNENINVLEFLKSKAGPIVIVKNSYGLPLEQLAPDTNDLGIFLPTSPLHLYLFGARQVEAPLNFLVVTSGNIHGAPMAITEQQALFQLKDVADFFITHNRPILRSVDDSLVKPISLSPSLLSGETLLATPKGSNMRFSPFGLRSELALCAANKVSPESKEGDNEIGDQHPLRKFKFLRRGRGFAPTTIKMKKTLFPIIAFGGDLKNTFCVTQNQKLHVSPHMGDLYNAQSYKHFIQSIGDFLDFTQIKPKAVVVDMHPGYASTQQGKSFAQENNLPLIEVQHHLAHAVSVMSENNLSKSIALTFDGTGYGTDNSLWGGECLYVDLSKPQWTRVASLELMYLLGGEKAVLEPKRLSYERLQNSNIKGTVILEGDEDYKQWHQLYENKKMFPTTSSMGRLFDAVSALLLPQYSKISYEGQAAIALESLAKAATRGREYSIQWLEEKNKSVSDGRKFNLSSRVNTSHLFAQIYEDQQHGVAISEIAFGFHLAVAQIGLEMAQKAQFQHDENHICLSGGVFLNSLFCDLITEKLHVNGFEVFEPVDLPIGDGGLCLGQAMYASLLMEKGFKQSIAEMTYA